MKNPKSESRLTRVLAALVKLHGGPRPSKAADAYELLIFTNCGYPASERACVAGFSALKASVGISPQAIVGAPRSRVVAAMRKGGIVPELRAGRLREIAGRILTEYDGRLDLARMSIAEARKVLKTFPTIGDPGADKILLFSRAAPLAAVPSNATQVPLRIGFGTAQSSYAAGYRSAQAALDAELPRTFDARIRAYLLFKKHGEEVCKRSNPKCEICPVRSDCAYFANASLAR